MFRERCLKLPPCRPEMKITEICQWALGGHLKKRQEPIHVDMT